MREIVQLSADFQVRLNAETENLIGERSTARAILEARIGELATMRDAELKRIEQWAEQQMAMVRDVFGVIISESQADIERCDAVLSRLGGEARPVKLNRPPLKMVGKAATAFAKAAE